MRTVKEISEITGISVRTLHYYDEIGLLQPTQKSEAGYRLYDDQALETLRQVLFFREFEISLKEIKKILDQPFFDQTEILQMQRKMLFAKKERLERLLESIDTVMKGEKQMNFAVFNHSEIEELFAAMTDHMPEEILRLSVKEFGSMEAWKKHYLEAMASEEMQKGYAKVVGWYGGKEHYLSVTEHPVSKEVAENYDKEIEKILQKLSDQREQAADSLEVQALVAGYAFLMKKFSRVHEEQGLLLAQAKSFQKDPIRSRLDQKYGAGAAEFFAQAITAFYQDAEA